LGRIPSTVDKKERDKIAQQRFYEKHKERLRKEKVLIQQRWRKNNPEEYKEMLLKQSKRVHKKKYGLTPEEWDALFINQGSRCAICTSTKTAGHGWHTDHCHSQNKVRGILCYHCNVMLGLARDNITTLNNAIEYLKAHTNEQC
jgi:Recombination endonuclease VII